MTKFSCRGFVAAWVALGLLGLAAAQPTGDADPPALNPFGEATADGRDDAVPGYVELSTGKIVAGQVYLTRDARLRILDEQAKRFRDVPLRVARRIDCNVSRTWVEREWRFQENANDAKVYTGRSYPAREYVHVITLDDGSTIRGPLSAIVYVRPDTPGAKPRARPPEPIRVLLHQRDKGAVGSRLDQLVYVKSVVLGEEALAEARKRSGRSGTKVKEPARPPSSAPGKKAGG